MNLAPLLIAMCCTPALAQVDPRFAGPPARYADGSIKRSTAELAKFARIYPCPSSGEVTGSCPGWAIDHVVPLACGGADAVHNLQWLPVAIKSCAAATGVPCKDRFERRVYRTTIPC